MKRIGIMGFKGDPLHWLHVLIAELARVQHKLDIVYCVTSGQPADKDPKEVTDKEIRHEMVVALVGNDPYLVPSRVEIDRDGPSYMVDTIRHFRGLHEEDSQFFLIIGEDRAPTLKKWHQVDELVKLCTVLVAPRMNTAVDKKWCAEVLPAGTTFDTIEMEFSSTFIRRQRALGRDIRWLCPPEVIAVIEKHGLYAPPTVQSNPNRSDDMNTVKKGIRSILDTDLYKLTMMWAVLKLYPNVRVGYKFTDRKAKGKWTAAAVAELQRRINAMSDLRLTPAERNWCELNMPWVDRAFWDYLQNYRFDPSEVAVSLDAKNNLQIKIKGLWCRTILWEVPLMALICEVYYDLIDTNWTEEGQVEKMEAKAAKMAEAGVLWGDFGTRRRRHFEAQERVVVAGKKYKNFTGTSNVYLAMKHGVKALGTMAHEWIMAHSALFSLKHANRYALNAWAQVYNGELGTALPDTFGTDAFLRDFDSSLARLFDSVRHDSGDPKVFAEKMIAHYKKLRIDWTAKPLGFTDGNSADSAIEIHKWYTAKGGKCWFGIGTSLSNDYGDESPALSIVIKLEYVEDPEDGSIIWVVKISDTPEKATGNEDAKRVALWTHFGTPLDEGRPDPDATAGKAA